jgi:hypothetical protein
MKFVAALCVLLSAVLTLPAEAQKGISSGGSHGRTGPGPVGPHHGQTGSTQGTDLRGTLGNTTPGNTTTQGETPQSNNSAEADRRIWDSLRARSAAHAQNTVWARKNR